jgi:nitrile hydratase accessory protein
MTTLNPLELPGLPRDEAGPAFAEPWQAEAFALAISLSQAGYFTWAEWSAAARGEPDDGSRYYEHWLATLERLAVAKQLAESAQMRERKEAWATAYRTTPHGKPVTLG